MSSSDRVLAGVFTLCLLGMACLPADSGSEPRPRRLVPGWGMTTEAVAGLVEGDNFLEIVTQHVGGQEEVTLDARFEAFLGGVALGDVRREDEHRLHVRIPQGLAPGWHALTVVGPGGRRVELPRAFFASEQRLASLEARSGWARSQLWVGEQARLTLEVTNPGSTTALAVTAVLRPQTEGRTTVLSAPGVADIPPGASASFVWELRTDSAGEPRFAVDVQGREERVGLALEVVGVDVAPLEIRDRQVSALTTSLSANPRTISVGQQVRLSLRVMNPGPRAVLQVVPGVPRVEGDLANRVSGPSPARADLAPGASQDFEWTYVATSGGPLSFQVGAEGRDDFVGEAVAAPEALSPEVTVRTPGSLVAHFVEVPGSVSLGQPFDVVLQLSNTGDSAVKNVRIDEEGFSGGCRVELLSGPVPTSQDIEGHGSGLVKARLKGTLRGACVLRAGAKGTDATDGREVTAPPKDSSPVNIL